MTQQVILVVDDAEINRLILNEMLSDEFTLIEADNGEKALEILAEREVDLMMLDINMPVMDGMQTLREMEKRGYSDVPVIMISAETSPETIGDAYDLGAVDYITRPFDITVVKKRVTNTILLYAKQKSLMNLVEQQVSEREKSNNLMISILSHIVEFRNGESGLHVLHINILTEILLRKIREKYPEKNLTEQDISLMCMASSLHDIGKISIPEEILNKPGRLTDEEFAIMKTHSAIGSEMLRSIPAYQDEPLMKYSYEIARWHHERYDGRGYPDGLKGDEIPISAQVVSIADVYDALTSERVYKPAYSHENSVQMILGGECGSFNPKLLEVFMECQDEIQEGIKHDNLRYSTKQRIEKVTGEILGEVSSETRTGNDSTV